MEQLFWRTVKSKKFNLSRIVGKVNADKLFACFLLQVEEKEIDENKLFYIEEIADLIPRGTAQIDKHSTYGFSIMSMLSGQKDRDYFIFTNPKVKNDFSAFCKNNFNRDNYIWRKEYANEECRINPKYINNIERCTNEILVRENKSITLTDKDYKDFLLFLYFGKDKNYLDNCIDRAYRDFNRTLHGLSTHKFRDDIVSESKIYLKQEIILMKNCKIIRTQEEFDLWHKGICYGLKNIFKNYGYVDFYVGQAQKWINMSLKYVFVHDVTRLDGFNNIYEYCHIPIDNIILLKLHYLKFSTAWSRIDDYDIYLDFQKYIRDIAVDEIPIEFEFRLFIK